MTICFYLLLLNLHSLAKEYREHHLRIITLIISKKIVCVDDTQHAFALELKFVTFQ